MENTFNLYFSQKFKELERQIDSFIEKNWKRKQDP